MKEAARAATWVLGLSAAALGGCSSSSALGGGSCAPGSVVACTCPGGVGGSQTCAPDGRQYGGCACGVLPPGAGTGASSGLPLAGSGNLAGSLAAGSGGSLSGGADAAVPPAASGPGSVIAVPSDEAAFLWDDTKLRTFELNLPQANLDAINANPAAEQYVEGSFTLEGETVPGVGIRYKGSVGAFSGCTSGPNPFMPTGAKTCPKLSMKVGFNWKDPAARFHGLKKLDFHSMNEDDSLMRDRLGYALFRAMNVAAPRAVHARLLINGNFAGLFALVEEVDGSFTDSRFTAAGDGNLYKEIWPKWTDAATYTPALETNRGSPTLSFDRVVRFATALSAAADDAAVNALADQWMDARYVMDFIAVDRTIRHDDGMFHWYCTSGSVATGNNPGQCSNHNYFWYEEDKWDRLWLVAWDVTLSFGATFGGVVTIVDEWDNTAVACSPKPGELPFALQLPPSCDKLTHAWAARQPEYKAAVRRFLDGPYSAASVDAMLGAWEAQIAPVVAEAAAAGHTPSTSGFQQALSSLRTTIANLRATATTRAQ